MGDKPGVMRSKASARGKQVGDQWETSLASCVPRHQQLENKRERQPGEKGKVMRSKLSMYPFQRSKNSIQVNLFGEKGSITQQKNTRG